MPDVLAPVRPIFRAFAVAVVPQAASLSEAGWREAEEIVAGAIAQRPAGLQRQLLLFLRILNAAPVVRFGRTLTALDPARRARVLAAFQDSPLLLLRRGFWGWRTLVYMGYYARPEAAAEIGYRAHLRGWTARAPREVAR